MATLPFTILHKFLFIPLHLIIPIYFLNPLIHYPIDTLRFSTKILSLFSLMNHTHTHTHTHTLTHTHTCKYLFPFIITICLKNRTLNQYWKNSLSLQSLINCRAMRVVLFTQRLALICPLATKYHYCISTQKDTASPFLLYFRFQERRLSMYGFQMPWTPPSPSNVYLAAIEII